MNEQSILQKKRQTFRKQIRRQQLDEKFRKIRVSLNSTHRNTQQDEKNKHQLQVALHLIKHHDYFSPFDEGNYQSDSLAYHQIHQLFFLYEQHLQLPDQRITTLLQQPAVQAQIRLRWETIYKWQSTQEQTVKNIIKTIANTLSVYSYNQTVTDFLLKTIEFLIYGNKVMLMKRIAFAENQKVYLVGGPDKYYNPTLRFICKNLIMNFTAPNDDQLLLPFIPQISSVIKQSSYFAHAYHNIFLTQDIPLTLKLRMYHDFITMIESNHNILHDGDISYPAIFYIILTNRPVVTRIGVKTPFSSSELNYRCLCIINRYVSEAKLVIDTYSSNPHSEEYRDVVANVAYCLEAMCREEEWVLGKIPEMESVLDFIIRRIKAGRQLAEIKCMRVVLYALARLSQFSQVYSETCSRKVLLPIELQRLFDKLWHQLFSQSLSNQTRLALKAEKTLQYFQAHKQFSYEPSSITFESQYTELQLDCLTQIIKIYKHECNPDVKPWHYLQQKVFEKVIVVCNSYILSGVRDKQLKVLKDESLEFVCTCLDQLLKVSSDIFSEKSNYSFQDILIGEFFFSSSQNYLNLFALFCIEIDQLINNPQAGGILVVEVILPVLRQLLLRLLTEIQYFSGDYSYERSKFCEQKWYEFIEKDRWVIIYHEYSQVHKIPKTLDNLLNSHHKCIENNENAIRIINDILKMADHISEMIVPSQKFPIELEK